MKQASRQWNVEFSDFLKSIGCSQFNNDYCLFVKSYADSFMALLVYVDDVILTGTSITDLDDIKVALHSKFTIKDLGYLKCFLGLKVARLDSATILSQTKFTIDILIDVGMLNYKLASFPLPRGLHLSPNIGEPLLEPDIYRNLVGRSLYVNLTRADISHSIQYLSPFMTVLRKPH